MSTGLREAVLEFVRSNRRALNFIGSKQGARPSKPADGSHTLMNERRVGDMTESPRKILAPTKESANWRCSECAWLQPFVQRLELVPDAPTKAIEDAFIRHKCSEHRRPKWIK